MAAGIFNLAGFGEADFNIAAAATPTPATLPLFVSAIGGLSFVGWRRRKAKNGALLAKRLEIDFVAGATAACRAVSQRLPFDQTLDIAVRGVL
jgi:hypothetical protein